MNPDLEPYLYILVRNDLASLNAGKAVAQGSHGATHFMATASVVRTNNPDSHLAQLFQTWLGFGTEDGFRGFGTKIALSANAREIQGVVDIASQIPDRFLAATIVDPTYPLRDGDTTHFLPLMTCGYVFGHKPYLVPLVGRFPLMP